MNPKERMRCERLSADIPVWTCLARQKSAKNTWRTKPPHDPGCADCAQGKAVAARAAGTDRGTREKKEEQAMETKACKRCGVEKPLGDFYPVRLNRDGRDGSCKACRNKKRLSKLAGKIDEPVPAPEDRGRNRAGRSEAAAAELVLSPEGSRLHVVVTIDCAGLLAAIKEVLNPKPRRAS